jgi:hypothetical protein
VSTGITVNKSKKILSNLPPCVKLVDWHCFDANPDPDMDRHQNGKSDPDRHRFHADPKNYVFMATQMY